MAAMKLGFLLVVTTLCLVSIDCHRQKRKPCTVQGLEWNGKGSHNRAHHLPSGHLADGDFVPFIGSLICMQCDNSIMKFVSCKPLDAKKKKDSHTINNSNNKAIHYQGFGDKQLLRYHAVFKRHHRSRGNGHRGRGSRGNNTGGRGRGRG